VQVGIEIKGTQILDDSFILTSHVVQT